jgi:hypothetical protein
MRLQTIYPGVLAALMFAFVVVGSGNAATQRTLVAPTISDFTPKTGLEGTKVVITGSGLTGAKVELFGVLAPGVVNPQGTAVTVTVPAPPADVVPAPAPITLSTPGGVVTSAANFAYGATTSSKTAQPTTAKYYTYKAQVKLTPGQTLHFKTGKGYYAA